MYFITTKSFESSYKILSAYFLYKKNVLLYKILFVAVLSFTFVTNYILFL